MGYLSCKTGSAIVSYDSHKKEKKPCRPQIFSFKDLEAATGGFAVETLLGKGSHGCVYKGVLGNGMLVAVKRSSHGRRLLHDEAAFDNEIQILSQLNNPRLVKLLGFCHDSKEKLLVVEFMHNGTLDDILHDSPEPLSWPKRVHLALQTARAVLDLHKASPPIIHRDIKSSNILIDRHWNAKLGDFGLALWGHTGLSTPPAGTLGYLDPEYTTPEMLSTKNDVFSFGILLLEIMSGRNAIDVHYHPPSILDWALPLIKAGKALAICDPRLHPPKSTSALKQMATIAARCVRSRSSKRPDMADVVEHLQEISRRICFPMFNGFARKMKRTVTVGQNRQISAESCSAPHVHIKSPRRGRPRSPKVYDESPGVFNHSSRARKIDHEVIVHCSPADLFCHPTVVLQAPSLGDQQAQKCSTDSRARRRALVDLFREPTGEVSYGKPVEWQAVARASDATTADVTKQEGKKVGNRQFDVQLKVEDTTGVTEHEGKKADDRQFDVHSKVDTPGMTKQEGKKVGNRQFDERLEAPNEDAEGQSSFGNSTSLTRATGAFSISCFAVEATKG